MIFQTHKTAQLGPSSQGLIYIRLYKTHFTMVSTGSELKYYLICNKLLNLFFRYEWHTQVHLGICDVVSLSVTSSRIQMSI